MKFDVYANYTQEVEVNDNETAEKTIRKRYGGIDLDETKKVVNDFLDSIPENTTHIWLNVEKTYEERLDAALKSI